MAVEERSMVERVAIHLCRTHQEVDFSKARAYARAAIEAMKVPTESMVKAGHDEFAVCEFGVPLTRSCMAVPRDIFQTMIDAALSA